MNAALSIRDKSDKVMRIDFHAGKLAITDLTAGHSLSKLDIGTPEIPILSDSEGHVPGLVKEDPHNPSFVHFLVKDFFVFNRARRVER